MTRVFVDCHMFSVDWFVKDVLPDLVRSQNVLFTYGEATCFKDELSRTRKALEFYKRMGQIKKRADVDTKEMERHVLIVKACPTYANCNDCDDPHVFALCYIKPTPYIFSEDARMARCRTLINTVLDNRYCNFAVIRTKPVYDIHRGAILA